MSSVRLAVKLSLEEEEKKKSIINSNAKHDENDAPANSDSNDTQVKSKKKKKTKPKRKRSSKALNARNRKKAKNDPLKKADQNATKKAKKISRRTSAEHASTAAASAISANRLPCAMANNPTPKEEEPVKVEAVPLTTAQLSLKNRVIAAEHKHIPSDEVICKYLDNVDGDENRAFNVLYAISNRPPATLPSSRRVECRGEFMPAIPKALVEGLKDQAGTPENGRIVAVLSNGVIMMGVITDVIGDGPYQIEIDFDHDNGPPVTHTFPDRRAGHGMFLFGNARAKQQAAAMAAAAAAVGEVDASDDKKVLSRQPATAVDEGGNSSVGDSVLPTATSTSSTSKKKTKKKKKSSSVTEVQEAPVPSLIASVGNREFTVRIIGVPDAALSQDELAKEISKEVKKKIMSGMKLSQVNDSAVKALDVTSSTIIGIREGYKMEDLTPDQQLLVGYNQSDDPPENFNQEDCNPIVYRHHQNKVEFMKVMSTREMTNLIDGKGVPFNLPSLPLHLDKLVTKLMFLFFNYQTWEEYLGLKLKDGRQLHSARAMRSAGHNRSATPGLSRSSMGTEIFINSGLGDMFPFAYPKDGKPTDVVTSGNLQFIMTNFNEIFLTPLVKDPDVVIALGSVGTANAFSKYVLGGSIERLHKLYEQNEDKFISADPNSWRSGVHPSAIYEYCMVMLEKKISWNAEFYTNYKRVATGNPNVEECTFGKDLLNENSVAFAFLLRVWLEKCSLGGTNCCALRDEMVILYFILIESELTPIEALKYIMNTESPEGRNLVVGYLKTVAAQELAVRMGKGEVFGVGHDDVVRLVAPLLGHGFDAASLLKNAEVFMINHLLFTATSKLAARIGTEKEIDVNHVEVKAIAVEYGVDVATLVKNVKAFQDNQSLFTATTKLAARIGMEEDIDVNHEAVKAIVAEYGVDVATLVKNIEAFRDNSQNNQSLFTATSKFAARIGMEEDIDVNHEAVKAIAAEYGVDVATLVENVKAFADTHSLFGAKSKLAARIRSGGIDVDELNKMAAQLGMNGETLLDKATEFGDNNRSSIQSTNDKKWETHYSDLVEYHKKYKHCCVKPSEDEQLNTWVKNQRRRISDLSDDRIAKLNELGFVWVVGRGRNS